MPPEIALEITVKNRLRREWQRFRDPATKRRLNAKIAFIRMILTTHRQDEWDQFLDSLSPDLNSIYRLNKKLLHKVPATHPLDGPNGPLFTAADKSELFATEFQKQFSLNPGLAVPEVETSLQNISNTNTSSKIFTTPGTIQHLIKRLPNRKAPGEDTISNTALKNLPEKFVLLLTRIINGCLRLSYFPKPWKCATIITIPKSGKDLKTPSNYRPIALLSSMSKVFERVILHELNLSIGAKIREEQFAFRREHSTTLQLTKLTDELCNHANNKETTAAIFLDVEKAFDRVWHEGLVHKIHKLGAPLQITKTIQSFLTDRSFKVRVDNTLSSERPILAGVPQGSCLSPMLFSIYSNDIPVSDKARVSLFADDTLFYTHDINPKRATIRLQNQINTASSWFDKWRLRINPQKTVAILFNRKMQDPQCILLKGIRINWSKTVKYLGVILDKRLSLGSHVKASIQNAHKIRGSLYTILNRKSPIPIKSKLTIFQLYVRSIISYAGPAWGSLISKTNWQKLESIQNIGHRVITGVPQYVSNHTLRQSLRTSTIEEFVKKNTKIMFHKNSISNFNHLKTLGRETVPHLKNNHLRPYDWSQT